MVDIAGSGYSSADQTLKGRRGHAGPVEKGSAMNDTLYTFLLVHHLTVLRWVAAVTFTAILFFACACLLRCVLKSRLLRITLASVTALALGGFFLFEVAAAEARADLAALEALPRTANGRVTLKDAGNHKVYEIFIPSQPSSSEVSSGSMRVQQSSPTIIRDFDCSLFDGLRKEFPEVFDFVFPGLQQAPRTSTPKVLGPSLRI
jgi:hypothetical protein